jgi:hypothetical protein
MSQLIFNLATCQSQAMLVHALQSDGFKKIPGFKEMLKNAPPSNLTMLAIFKFSFLFFLVHPIFYSPQNP